MHKRQFASVLLLLFLLGLPTLTATHSHWRPLEASVRDALSTLLPAHQPDSRLWVVDIDEPSLAQVGAWPWTRAQLAALSQRLLDAGAAVVILDMVLPEARDAAGDAALLALAQQRRLVLAQVFDYQPRQAALSEGELTGALPAVSTQPPLVPLAPTATGFLGNHAALASAPCVGSVGFLPDSDGVLRRLPLVSHFYGHDYPSLALAAWRCVLGEQAPWPSVHIGHDGWWQLAFRVPPEAWPALPAARVLSARPLPALDGAWVLVGSSALGLKDSVATPRHGHQAGVLVHAEALDQLLHPPLAPPPAWLLNAVSMLLLGACLLFLLWRPHLGRLLMVIAASWVIWAALALLVVARAGDQMLSGWVLLWLGFVTVVVPLEWQLNLRQLFARNRILSRYVSPAVLEELVAHDGDVLQPRHAHITVLTADMQDFTRLTVNLSLEESALLIRRLLDELSGAVWAEHGTLDKYLGDGLLAFWGAPLPQADAADAAVRAACAMRQSVARWNRERRAQGLTALRVRVGIATGQALVGDLGTRERSAFSAMGDCLAVSARLQRLAKDLPDEDILLCGQTAAELSLAVRFLGVYPVRGVGDVRLYAPAACD